MQKFPVRMVPFRRTPISRICLIAGVTTLLFSCAQQGTLTGGAKDEIPPKVVSATPANFSTQFNSKQVEITFDEYFSLKDINKQLVVSPPMAKKPDFKIKGKVLNITFKDSLQPDRTYAINFGSAVVDLNEGNPIKNFQYVFSTGDSIDSLEVSGRVIQAFDGKPVDDILVMLYNGYADSLPLKTIPLYISRTDKEGRFTLKNLAGGSYMIFALKDGNTNYRFDQPTESIAFQDSLIQPSVILAAIADSATAARDSVNPVKDSLISLKKPLKVVKDSTEILKDSVNQAKKINDPDQNPADTIPVKPKYHFLPDNIELRLFTEVKPNQYLSGTDRLRREQLRFNFNQTIDSLMLDFLDLPADSVEVSLEWQGDPDTVDFWIRNHSMAARDSLTTILRYPAYDSVENRYAKTDTVKLRFRSTAKPPAGSKKDFTVSVSVEKTKTLEFGQPLVLTTSLPYSGIDTAFIHLAEGKDSVGRRKEFTLVPDTLKGFVLNGIPIVQTHPRIMKLKAGFSADTTYRLTILPGAFTGIGGQKNDTLTISFKMKNRDQYGTVKLSLPELKGMGIIELLDSRGTAIAAKKMNGPGTVTFDVIAPGKYSARLIFDENGNGRWDTGRFIRHVQPEKVMMFTKELNIKANWEVSETWQWED